MRKISALLLISAICIDSTVFAADYDLKNNSVSGITDETYQTIMVLRETEPDKYDDIVYIGQANSNETLSSAMEFYLKEDVPEGKYLVKLGGKADEKTVDILEFYITSPLVYGNEQYAEVFKENDTVAFGWENIENIAQYKSILIQIDDRVFGLSMDGLPEVQGEGAVSLGMKITELPAAAGDVDAYLSTNSVENGSLTIR